MEISNYLDSVRGANGHGSDVRSQKQTPILSSTKDQEDFSMIKLVTVFAISLIFAYISEHNTKAMLASGEHYCVWKDWAYIGLVVVLVLFAGLRTSYNDTWNYVNGFNSAPGVSEWLSDPENFNPFKNPLFYFCENIIKTVFDDAQMLIFLSSLITQSCFIRFFKRYSEHFLFSIFIYFTLGTFVFTLAAIKQVLGMAIVTLAFPFLEKKKWIPYFLIVIVAMLVHTYSIVFIVLPLFRNRPWKLFTFLFVAVTAVVMMNFKEAITAFMEQANELGKTLAEYEVFADNTINIFRLAVYAVPPVLSFIFQKWIFRDSSKMDHVLVHMSIISLAFMSMGTQSGANMFARMAMYFELGTICCLPQMINKTFEKRSHRLVSGVAISCFFVFFLYANAVAGDFGQDYRWVFS